jgi:very-short-patch-repair endonuclease
MGNDVVEVLQEKIRNKNTRALGRIFSTDPRYKAFLQDVTPFLPEETNLMERLYCWHHQIAPIACKICGSVRKFKGFKVGYSCKSSCEYQLLRDSLFNRIPDPNIVNVQDVIKRFDAIDVKPAHVSKFIIKNDPILFVDMVALTSHLPKDCSVYERMYWIRNDLTEFPMCSCGKRVKFNVNSRSYVRFCSSKCMANDDEVIRKRIETSEQRFGKGNYNNREQAHRVLRNRSEEEVRSATEKGRSTRLERYGDEGYNNPDKIKQTNLERHGHEHAFQSEEVKQKIVDTKVERYGSGSYVNPEKAKTTKSERYGDARYNNMDQVKKTKLERYEDPFYNNSKQISETKQNHTEEQKDEINQKRIQTNIERFGSEHPQQNLIIRKKTEDTCLERYGSKTCLTLAKSVNIRIMNGRKRSYEYFKRFSHKVVPLFSLEEYFGNEVDPIYRWKCVLCENEFNDGYYDGRIPRCEICFPKMTTGSSQMERDVAECVRSLGFDSIKINRKNVISPLELDVYVPERKLAIEFDGLFWHGESRGMDPKYHLNKTIACEEKGIRLVHVFEDEWIDKELIVRSRLAHLLSKSSNVIYARKCQIIDVDSVTCSEFMDVNHIQGSSNDKIRYGLVHDDELVAVMTFSKPRFSKKYEWELVRYASILDTSVVGGAGKLFKHFVREHVPSSIISYADRRWSQGNLYEKIGFELSHVSSPGYWYIVDGIREHRVRYQKHKLKDKLDQFDPDLTEWQNMQVNGYDRVWDCGNYVFVWKS